jgi:hypothetical protein
MHSARILLRVLLLLPVAAAVGQISDTTPPALVSLSFTPSAVDVTTEPKAVNISARITDNLAGFSSGILSFSSPSGQSVITQFVRTSGTATDGVYRGSVTIGQFSEAGIWKVSVVRLMDSTNNVLSLLTSDLEQLRFPTDLTVTSVPDTQPPQLTGISITPASVDVSRNPQTVNITLNVTDNLAGVEFSFWPRVRFRSPSGRLQLTETGTLTLVSGTPSSGVWRGVMSIPRYTEPGTWKLHQIVLIDRAANDRILNETDLAATGFPTDLNIASSPADLIAPTITGFSFSPTIINTAGSAQVVTARLSIRDNLSGAQAFDIFYRSPSGLQSNPRPCCFFNRINLVSGTPLNGTTELNVSFPRFSETGTWKVSGVGVIDNVGNSFVLDTDDLASSGFPTELVVYRPSLTPDGVIGGSGGVVTDDAFGARASITFPAGAISANTNVAIDVLSSSLNVPTPAGFSTGTLFVNVDLNPTPAMPFPAPGLTVVLPLPAFTAPGTLMNLYRLDPGTGLLVPAVRTGGGNVTGTVGANGLSATFGNVSRLSTLAGFVPTAVVGDVNGDGRVDCTDLAIVKASYGKRTGQAGFDSRADVNRNGVVDIADLALVSRQLPIGTKSP